MLSELKVSYSESKPLIPYTDPRSAAGFFRSVWDPELIRIQEHFYAMFLNHNKELLGYRLINMGTSKKIHIDTKLLFATALQSFCSSIIVAHNHPSGKLYASKADKGFAWQLKRQLELFDIKLLDYMILTADGYCSFAEDGRMDNLYIDFLNSEE